MKKIKLPDLRSPNPNKARALLGLFCRREKKRDLPGYSLTRAQRADAHELDRQNTILARELAFYVYTGDPSGLQGNDDLEGFERLVCELFALGFTSIPAHREKVEEFISSLECGEAWGEFEWALEQRYIDLRTLAEIKVSGLRDYLFGQLKEREAA